MSESQQDQKFVTSLVQSAIPLAPNTAVSPCSSPLETFRTSQAAKRNKEKLLYSQATILSAPGKFTPNYCLPLIYIKPEFQPPPSFAKTFGGLASEGGGWNPGIWSIACVASCKAAKGFKSTFSILLTAWQSKQQKHRKNPYNEAVMRNESQATWATIFWAKVTTLSHKQTNKPKQTKNGGFLIQEFILYIGKSSKRNKV